MLGLASAAARFQRDLEHPCADRKYARLGGIEQAGPVMSVFLFRSSRAIPGARDSGSGAALIQREEKTWIERLDRITSGMSCADEDARTEEGS